MNSIDDTDRLSTSERRLLNIMQNSGDHEVVAVGIVEVRAAQRFVAAGIAEVVDERRTSVDRWGAGSMRIRLTPGN